MEQIDKMYLHNALLSILHFLKKTNMKRTNSLSKRNFMLLFDNEDK